MKKLLIYFAIILTGFLIKNPVFAFQIQSMPNKAAIGDFVMGPGKTEVFVNPGEKVTKEMTVSNRSGKTMDFIVQIEDFTGTDDINGVVSLLGDVKGPYSLRDYIHPEIMKFTLNQAEKITIPVVIDIPADADPGGRYGAVIISTAPQKDAAASTPKTEVRTISRLGSLFFVRVNGAADEDGQLKEFRVKGNQNFFEYGPINFEALFQNNGNVHLTPFGHVEIKNVLNRKVGEITIEPWFVMPGSNRLREVKWDREGLFGRYEAKIFVNRGYGDIIDEKTIYFWVIPWKLISIITICVAILIFLAIKYGSKFEIQIKRKG